MITVPGLIGSGLVKTTFFPFIEGDNLTVNLSMVSGTREGITRAELDRIEDVVWEVNGELSAQRDDSLAKSLEGPPEFGPVFTDVKHSSELRAGKQESPVHSTNLEYLETFLFILNVRVQRNRIRCRRRAVQWVPKSVASPGERRSSIHKRNKRTKWPSCNTSAHVAWRSARCIQQV